MSAPNENASQEEEERERTRGEIEVLILVSGLILTPLLYLWQQELDIVQMALPLWQSYLASRLGTQYDFGDLIASYFTPFALSRALPVDVVIWAYDLALIMATLSLLIFAAALVAIERRDVGRVARLVAKGRRFLDMVLLLIIFFAVLHLLTSTLFPFRLMLGSADLWTCFGIALLTSILLKKWFNRYINEVLSMKTVTRQRT